VHAIISLEKNNDFITPSMIAKKINEYGFKNSVGKKYSAIAIGKTLKELGLQTINKKIDGKKFRIIPIGHDLACETDGTVCDEAEKNTLPKVCPISCNEFAEAVILRKNRKFHMSDLLDSEKNRCILPLMVVSVPSYERGCLVTPNGFHCPEVSKYQKTKKKHFSYCDVYSRWFAERVIKEIGKNCKDIFPKIKEKK
jgi:hypothetical protein